MQPCFKDQVVEICHFCSDTCHPGLRCSAVPVSGARAICEHELSYYCQGTIQVFIYLFSVEVDAIVHPKLKLCCEYQEHRQQNETPNQGKIQEASPQSC